jgi:peptidoglycan biosynthesis protein MviN/MurJ (putative lipid II flippase)
MNLYNKMFASAYVYYSRFHGESPLAASVSVVFVSQATSLTLILALAGKLVGYNPFSNFTSKLYYLPFLVIWFIALFRYYSKPKVKAVVDKFKLLTSRERTCWGILTCVMFILPFVLILIVARK